MKLILQNYLFSYLYQPEFIEGIEKQRLKTAKLIKLAFRYNPHNADTVPLDVTTNSTRLLLSSSSSLSSSSASSVKFSPPSVVIHNLGLLMSSNALNIFSSSAIDALHEGILYWQSLHYSIEASAKLLISLLSELSTYDEVGLFLSLFVSSSHCIEYQRTDLIELLYRIIAHPDIRDLGGNRKDLDKYLEDYMDEIHEFMVSEGKHTLDEDSDNSDADSQGNLDGFVVYSEEDEDDTEDESDSSTGNEDDSTSGTASNTSDISGSTSISSSKDRPNRQPSKQKITNTDKSSSCVTISTNTVPSTKRKRLQRTIHKENKDNSDNETVSSMEEQVHPTKKSKVPSTLLSEKKLVTNPTNKKSTTTVSNKASSSSSSSSAFSKYYDFDAFQE